MPSFQAPRGMRDLLPEEAAAFDALQAVIETRALRYGYPRIVTPIVEDVPVTCDERVVRASEEACRELGLTMRPMTSGAYHDAMIMGRCVPVGMIFVPSAGGVSRSCR